jgi:arsenate reductase-like glutaredoxin family protein
VWSRTPAAEQRKNRMLGLGPSSTRAKAADAIAQEPSLLERLVVVVASAAISRPPETVLALLT